MWRKQQMVDMLKSMDMYVSDCRFQQETALRSVMPFLKIAPSLEKKAKRNVLTSGAASTYMFTSYELSDDTGVLLGINRHNNSLCIVDLFNTKRNKNANLNLIGTSGAGKTFTLQLLALRMRMRGIQCFILAPIKGHEFRRACNAVGGQFIRIAPGSPHCINIMEIRHTIAPEMELIDAMDYVELGSMLANKIQQLMIFFSLLIPDMTNEEEQLLDEALIKTYADFGITHDNESVYEDATVTPPKMKQMPILGDLHKHLLENKMTERIAVIVSRFVTGSAQSFNRQTNVDLSNKYIVFDLSELKGKLLPVGMMIALDYVWDSVKKDLTKKKAVMIDEIWKLVGTSSNKQAAEFCLTIFKTIRGFGGAAVSATISATLFTSMLSWSRLPCMCSPMISRRSARTIIAVPPQVKIAPKYMWFPSLILGLRIFDELETGDIIIFRRDGSYLVKRIAACAGDTIDHQNSIVTVPDNCYYVLGDNAENSHDSRYWADPYVSHEDVIAKLLMPIK